MTHGYYIGILSGLLWAISGVSYNLLYNKFPSLDSLFFSILALFLIEFFSLISISYFHLRRKCIPPINKGNFIIIFSGLLGGPIAMLCYLNAIQLIGASHAAAITSTYPILAAFLSIKFLKEKKEHLSIFIFIISSTIFLNIEKENTFNILGLILSVIASFSWASEIFLSSYTIHKNKKKSEDVYFIRQLSSTIGYIIIIFYIIFLLKNKSYIPPKEEFNLLLPILVIVLIISSGLSYFLYYKAIETLKPIKAMALNITYGAWSIILSTLLALEKLNIKSILTCLIIFTLTYILTREKK
ncbi:DMT family transporter [uncultured Aggregatibacter sp.]|uniref:DMT family transporter n=1 Tax=uncultured Aggregatibacter sp. TaxID=470564 RepID=UPI002593F650|nr:DMT family transporter [uncultured Aggregatibacter sp.]